jgi:hypothetical protein
VHNTCFFSRGLHTRDPSSPVTHNLIPLTARPLTAANIAGRKVSSHCEHRAFARRVRHPAEPLTVNMTSDRYEDVVDTFV